MCDRIPEFMVRTKTLLAYDDDVVDVVVVVVVAAIVHVSMSFHSASIVSLSAHTLKDNLLL